MDKGIRPAAKAKFAELLPQRAELGNKAFRAAVMGSLVADFGCSVPAAATHYNFAFQEVKKNNPELVIGLGRPEGKNNGGRKKKVVDATAPVAGDATPAADAAPVVKLYTVTKKDGTVVADGLTEELADALIAKAAKAKKGALTKA